jgi:CHASE3 domain sensor protein
MGISTTTRLVTGAVFVFSCTSIGTTLLSFHLLEQRKASNEILTRSIKAATELIAGSDALTTAVRAYAATGDERHRRDFQTELTVTRSRDRAIEALRAMNLTPGEMELLDTAKRNSDALVSLEDQAFAAAGAGDLRTAVALVYGDEYLRAKASIVEPIRRARADIETRFSQQAQDFSEQAGYIKRVALAASLLNIVTILGALLVFFQSRVVTPVATLTRKTKSLMAGDKTVRFGHEDDPSEIGGLARALEDYRQAGEEIERQRWIKNGLANLAGVVQQADTPESFATRLLSLLAPMLHCGAAALHLRDEQTGVARCVGGYGIDEERCRSLRFAPREGLVGEAMLEGKPIVVRDVPPDYLRIASGLGEHPPQVLVIAPVAIGGRVLAAIELASFSPLDDQ